MTPAFRLLAACCRWPAGETRTAAITAAGADFDDWPELTRLADRHRVEPLAVDGLAAAGLPIVPDLAAAADRYRAITLRDIGETLRTAAALTSAGIEHRFLKGAPLGVVAYGSALLKRSWDIDLLVRPADAVAAARALVALDYQSAIPPRPFDAEEFHRWSAVSKEAEFRSARGSVIELHWGVSSHPHLVPGLGLDSPRRLVALLGANRVSTFADAANLAYLAAHGTAHAWSRLKWIADFNALLASSSAPADLVAEAATYGVGRTLDTALALAQTLFGDGTVAAPERSLAVQRLVQHACVALGAEDGPEVEQAAARARWLLAAGPAYRLAELRTRLRGTLDRIDLPLPRRWQFLYPLLRIPLWIIRRNRQKATKSR